MNYVKRYRHRMSVVLCVRLWPAAGEEDSLAAYEDQVLALLPEHGGRLVARVRAIPDTATTQGVSAGGEDAAAGGHPFETQIIEFAHDEGLDAYMRDPRRVAASDVRDRVIARTDIQPVALV